MIGRDSVDLYVGEEVRWRCGVFDANVLGPDDTEKVRHHIFYSELRAP